MPGPAPRPVRGSLGRRLGWFALIWALSVAAMGAVAYGFRLLMALAGLTA